MTFTEAQYVEAEHRRWVERFTQHLDQIPVLIETMRERATGTVRAARYGDRVTGSHDTTPAPVDVSALDDCDDMWAVLCEYVDDVASRLQAAPLREAVWGEGGAVRGIRPVTTVQARTAAFQVVAWLVGNAPRIHPLGLTDTETHLFRTIRALVARYDLSAEQRPTWFRSCLGDDGFEGCGRRGVYVDWVGEESNTVVSGLARCKFCDHEYPYGDRVTEGEQWVSG